MIKKVIEVSIELTQKVFDSVPEVANHCLDRISTFSRIFRPFLEREGSWYPLLRQGIQYRSIYRTMDSFDYSIHDNFSLVERVQFTTTNRELLV